MEIAYINQYGKHDLSMPLINEFSDIYIYPYHLDSSLLDIGWKNIMEYQCGFKLEKVDENKYVNSEEIRIMSSYPNDGSIMAKDDVIIIKLS